MELVPRFSWQVHYFHLFLVVTFDQWNFHSAHPFPSPSEVGTSETPDEPEEAKKVNCELGLEIGEFSMNFQLFHIPG